MTDAYKIWLHIEKITDVGTKDEDYEEAAPFAWSLGEYETYEEAEDLAYKLEAVLPGLMKTRRAQKSVDKLGDKSNEEKGA